MELRKQTLEIMKILSDSRRSRILLLAAEKPLTVKEMAEELGEDHLRLYYHVKKLLKAELLEVVETRKHGNMSESVYHAVNVNDIIFRGDVNEQADHLELALASIHHRIDPGLRLFQKALEKVRQEKETGARFERLPYRVSINSATNRMTTKEWRKSMNPILKAMAKPQEAGAEKDWPELPSGAEADDETGTYEYVLISYRVEDAKALGLIDDGEEEGHEHED